MTTYKIVHANSFAQLEVLMNELAQEEFQVASDIQSIAVPGIFMHYVLMERDELWSSH